jgi:hypothetical protein
MRRSFDLRRRPAIPDRRTWQLSAAPPRGGFVHSTGEILMILPTGAAGLIGRPLDLPPFPCARRGRHGGSCHA